MARTVVTGSEVLRQAGYVMDARFIWSKRDCCTAACDLFYRLHGLDPMASLRGAYTTRREAEAIISQSGGLVRLARGLAAKSGLQAIPPDAAEPGDIGVIDNAELRALVISIGYGAWVGKAPRGRAIVLEGIEGAWCVKSG